MCRVGGVCVWLLMAFTRIAASAKNSKVRPDCQAAFGQRFDVIDGEVGRPAACAAPGLLGSKCFADLPPLIIVSALCSGGPGGLFNLSMNAIALGATSCACNDSAVLARSR